MIKEDKINRAMKRLDLLNEYYDLLHLKENKQDYVCASFLKGINYDVQDCRLLLIGRALNGWIEKFSKENNAEELLKLWQKHEENGNTMEYRCYWNKDSKQYEDVTEGEYSKGLTWVNTYIPKGNRHYLTAKKAFWKCGKYALAFLTTNENAEDFYKKIAWTNLFKLSPTSGGNPEGAIWNEQIKYCKSILEKEIEILNPTHILIVAKTNIKNENKNEDAWWSPFSDILENAKVDKNIKIAIIHRPEQRKFGEIEEEIRKGFREN